MLKTIILFSVLSVLVYAPCSAKTNIGDIEFSNKAESRKKTGMPAAVFPHDLHEQKIKCNKCHPKIFKKKRGANDVNMKKNMEEKFCGSCHKRDASPLLYECDKCHTKR